MSTVSVKDMMSMPVEPEITMMVMLKTDEVVALLRAALMSPSSKRSNCWQFVVVDEKHTLELLSKCKASGADFLKDAPLAIVVLADPLASDVWIEDASVASLMIQLQAEDLGWGVAGFRSASVIPLRGCLPANTYRVYWTSFAASGAFHHAIGHKGMERKPFDESRLLWEKVHLNKYKGE